MFIVFVIVRRAIVCKMRITAT